jgi:pimeloyl-ACP methyl ester carboxylesterase
MTERGFASNTNRDTSRPENVAGQWLSDEVVAGMGTDLMDDTALVRSYVQSLVRAGRTVVAIGHSYGGQVMTNALYGFGIEARSSQGLKVGVSNLIYLVG